MKGLFFILLLIGARASADYGAIYYTSSAKQEPVLFAMARDSLPPDSQGIEEQTAVYKNAVGEVLFSEKAFLKGDQLMREEIEQKQTSQSARVDVKDGIITFSKTSEGKTKTATEKVSGFFVMSGNFHRFIQSQWPALTAGKTVEFRYGVWDRMETVGFRLQKTSEDQVQGQKAFVLKMSPSSFLIRQIVDPLFFDYSTDGQSLLQMTGRVPVKKGGPGAWKDQDAFAVYQTGTH